MNLPPKTPPVYKPVPQRLAAPPVYRPNTPSTQLKPAHHFKLETRPAPPVYRPQQVQPGIQPIPSNKFRLETRPTAPAYRPQQSTGSAALQPQKLAIASALPLFKSGGVRPALAPVVIRPLMVKRFAGQTSAIQRMAYVSSALNWVAGFFNAPPPQPQVVPQHVPTAEERHQELLDRNRTHFMETGSPSYSEIREIYPNALDPVKWSRLTHVHGQKKNLKKRAQNQSPEAIHGLVRELFDNFVSYGFGYSIMTYGASRLLDSVSGQNSPNGSCLAFARAFADIVNSFGIEAEARYVRDEDLGRFIVKLDRFIDPTVRGHIYEKGVLKGGYYMFTSHAATWVPATGRFYDPMAVTWYTSLDPYIECELSSENETVFTPKTRPKTLCTGYEWKLIRREVTLPGQFNRLDLVPRKKKNKQK